MCNCEQKRDVFRQSDKSLREPGSDPGIVKVRLLQDQPFEISGDITGRKYRFKKKGDINWVDKRDYMLMASIKELGATIF